MPDPIASNAMQVNKTHPIIKGNPLASVPPTVTAKMQPIKKAMGIKKITPTITIIASIIFTKKLVFLPLLLVPWTDVNSA